MLPTAARLKPHYSISLLALLIANLVPLVGAVLFDWDALIIVVLYWTENLIIGSYNMLRMALLPKENPILKPSRLIAMAFFCIHYGGFCAGHGFFLVAIFEIGGGPDSFLPDATLSGVPWFVELLRILIAQLWTTRLIWPFLALVASHGISFAEHYFRKGERFRLTLADLMLHPYKRIAILHIAILGAGAFIEAFQSPLPLLVALVLLKIGLDIFLHCRSHRSRSEPAHQAANSVEC